ncbi:MAG: heparinase II/III-family protein, partial [Propionibacteriaceae bacterium]|nr:heparinase II/III-family protein [Propionibacteriaceae bacterium]
WISGNVLYAATLCEDPAEQAALRQSATNNLRRYVAALPLDGAIDEGAGYWWNGAGRLLEALDELHNADAAELLRLESVCNTVRFPAGMALGGGWCANFSDAAAYPEPLPWHLLFRAAMNTDDEAARAFAVAGARRDGSLALLSDGLPRVLRALKDKEWAAALTAAPDDRLPLQSWWPSTQVLVAHQSSDASGLGIAAKGGHNGENHNHLDVGSVIVASDGVPVIVDPGRPTYTADTFSEARYSIWTMRSDWHSVPQLAGRGQGVGEQFTARDVAATLTPKLASLQADIGGAYLTPGVSWLRTTTLDRANGVARISDSSDCADAYLHWIIAGDVTVRGESLLVHPARPAAAVNIRWEGATLQSVTERPLGDPTLQRVWGSKLTRLTLRPTGAQVKSSLEVSNRV